MPPELQSLALCIEALHHTHDALASHPVDRTRKMQSSITAIRSSLVGAVPALVRSCLGLLGLNLTLATVVPSGRGDLEATAPGNKSVLASQAFADAATEFERVSKVKSDTDAPIALRLAAGVGRAVCLYHAGVAELWSASARA